MSDKIDWVWKKCETGDCHRIFHVSPEEAAKDDFFCSLECAAYAGRFHFHTGFLPKGENLFIEEERAGFTVLNPEHTKKFLEMLNSDAEPTGEFLEAARYYRELFEDTNEII